MVDRLPTNLLFVGVEVQQLNLGIYDVYTCITSYIRTVYRYIHKYILGTDVYILLNSQLQFLECVNLVEFMNSLAKSLYIQIFWRKNIT